MQTVLKGPWDKDAIEQFLQSTTYPVRLACVAPDGFPRVVSLWYEYTGGALYCVSHKSAQIVALLQKCERVGFEVAPNEPPYSGVRGQGIAALASDAEGEMLSRLLDKYLGGKESSLASWLLSRAADEVLIRVQPQRLFSWDYRERME